jgi:hypothetical protein
MSEWLQDWQALIVPLRAQHGFEVVGARTIGRPRSGS